MQQATWGPSKSRAMPARRSPRSAHTHSSPPNHTPCRQRASDPACEPRHTSTTSRTCTGLGWTPPYAPAQRQRDAPGALPAPPRLHTDHPRRSRPQGPRPNDKQEAPRAVLTCPTPPTGPIELVCPRWTAGAIGSTSRPPPVARNSPRRLPGDDRRPVICSGHGDANHARARRARDARLTG